MTSPEPIRVLGICGSLRKKSFNMYALHAAGELMPPETTLHITSIADIPMYNHDVYEQGFPPAVQKFRSEIAAADGLLISSPEYNYSVTGVLKNAIDWASRQPNMPFVDKPIAIMSASPGPMGASRMHYDLRKILAALEAFLLVRPEVFIGSSMTRFDPEGKLVDEPTRTVVADQMAAFYKWIVRLRALPKR